MNQKTGIHCNAAKICIARFLLLGVCLMPPLYAEVFRFKYNAGDSYRILSTVQEDVFVNRRLDHHAEIINRITVKITAAENGNGTHEASFMTTENAVSGTSSRTFSWGTEYDSVFDRDMFGRYTIADTYFMPVVRDVPVFPEHDIPEGGTWQHDGEEAHDLRRTFNIDKPFKVPFSASYTYRGTLTAEGKTLHIIQAHYTMAYESPAAPQSSARSAEIQTADYPASTRGYSSQTIYWDNELGAIHSYEETFRITITTAFGNVLEFRGTANAEVTGQKRIGTDEAAQDIRRQLADLGVQDTSVTADDAGLTISLENISFEADSAVLLENEKLKLEKIASILKNFPDNDLLVSGHTALAGSASARLSLSKKRADAVASFLTQLGVKDAYHIFSQGFGAEKPIAPNDTESGRARNRRVEITVLQ